MIFSFTLNKKGGLHVLYKPPFLFLFFTAAPGDENFLCIIFVSLYSLIVS